MGWWSDNAGALIQAGGQILGGLMGSSAQQGANQTNVKLQRDQLAWQERMANTAYQRQVKDMLAAGINPMLAISKGGGADTPSVSAATVQPEDALGRAVGSAANVAMQAATLKNIQAQTKQTEAKAEQERIIANNMSRTYNVSIDGQDDMLTVENQQKRDAARKILAEANIAEIEEEIVRETKDANVSSAQARADLTRAQVDFTTAQRILTDLKRPEAQAMADWFQTVGSASPATKAVMSISQWLKYIIGGK